MATKANVSPDNSEDRRTGRDRAAHPAEAAVALPRTDTDKDSVWRYWRATWLGSDSNTGS